MHLPVRPVPGLVSDADQIGHVVRAVAEAFHEVAARQRRGHPCPVQRQINAGEIERAHDRTFVVVPVAWSQSPGAIAATSWPNDQLWPSGSRQVKTRSP